MRFALLGAAGYVAPKHMAAIQAVGGELVACMDPHDSVGVLDSYFPDAAFFTEFERFDRHIRKHPVDWVSIASPNYLHEPQIHWALNLWPSSAKVICEKPLCLNPDNLAGIIEARETIAGSAMVSPSEVFCCLQLRHLPALHELRRKVQASDRRHEVTFINHAPRGRWYDYSWKGDPKKSGGLAMNIGIHGFDLLIWIFGKPQGGYADFSSMTCRSFGGFGLEKAEVKMDLRIDCTEPRKALIVDGEEIPLVAPPDLHNRVYEAAMRGEGVTPSECRGALELVRGLG